MNFTFKNTDDQRKKMGILVPAAKPAGGAGASKASVFGKKDDKPAQKKELTFMKLLKGSKAKEEISAQQEKYDQMAAIEQAKVVCEDPTAYLYDEVYDEAVLKERQERAVAALARGKIEGKEAVYIDKMKQRKEIREMEMNAA